MKWNKKSLIYVSDGQYSWAKTHAMIPTPERVSENILRIYVTCCDEKLIGRIGYVEVDAFNPSRVLNISKRPVLDIGQPGTFDENGVLVTSIVTLPNGCKYLYYAGFELGIQIRYRLLTGVAMSEDGGETFKRIKTVPILERSSQELYFRGGAFVLLENNIFRLWYVAGSEWTMINGKSMPVYVIKYLESKDGIRWGDEGKVCISIESSQEHGFGRPYVVKNAEGYQMYYSIRTIENGYRLGYAESRDGLTWERQDTRLNLTVSEAGWDNETVCYSALISNNQHTYLLYNGNHFGQTGFGYAQLD